MPPSATRGVEFRLLRGTSADIAAKQYVPDAGEPVWIIDTRQLHVGDGSRVGGVQSVVCYTKQTFTDFLEDGSARTVELDHAPLSGTLEVMLNGLRLSEGADNDYVLDGTLLTVNYAVYSGDVIRANYVPY